jgi:ribose/xylose/arabinose/galactoside ABC-type transport system permease subunit
MLAINGLNMLGVDPASEQLIKGMIVLILVAYSFSVKGGKRV